MPPKDHTKPVLFFFLALALVAGATFAAYYFKSRPVPEVDKPLPQLSAQEKADILKQLSPQKPQTPEEIAAEANAKAAALESLRQSNQPVSAEKGGVPVDPEAQDPEKLQKLESLHGN